MGQSNPTTTNPTAIAITNSNLRAATTATIRQGKGVVGVVQHTPACVFSVERHQPPLFTPRARVRNFTGFFIHQPIQIHVVQLEERMLGTFFLVKNVLSHGHRSFITVALDCCPNGNRRQATFAAVVGENHHSTQCLAATSSPPAAETRSCWSAGVRWSGLRLCCPAEGKISMRGLSP